MVDWLTGWKTPWSGLNAADTPRLDTWPPRANGAAALYFPRPGDALASLSEVAGRWREAATPEDQEAYLLALRALALEAADIVPRQELFLDVGARIETDLTVRPELLEWEGFRGLVEQLTDQFFLTGRTPFVKAARRIERAVAAAVPREAPGNAVQEPKASLDRPAAERRSRSSEALEPQPWMTRRAGDLFPAHLFRVVLQELARDPRGLRLEHPAVRAARDVLGVTEAQLTWELANLAPPTDLRLFDPRSAFERVYRLSRSRSGLSAESRELVMQLGRALGVTSVDFQVIQSRSRLFAETA